MKLHSVILATAAPEFVAGLSFGSGGSTNVTNQDVPRYTYTVYEVPAGKPLESAQAVGEFAVKRGSKSSSDSNTSKHRHHLFRKWKNTYVYEENSAEPRSSDAYRPVRNVIADIVQKQVSGVWERMNNRFQESKLSKMMDFRDFYNKLPPYANYLDVPKISLYYAELENNKKWVPDVPRFLVFPPGEVPFEERTQSDNSNGAQVVKYVIQKTFDSKQTKANTQVASFSVRRVHKEFTLVQGSFMVEKNSGCEARSFPEQELKGIIEKMLNKSRFVKGSTGVLHCVEKNIAGYEPPFVAKRDTSNFVPWGDSFPKKLIFERAQDLPFACK